MKPMTAQHVDPKVSHWERLRELLLTGAKSQAAPVDPTYFEAAAKAMSALQHLQQAFRVRFRQQIGR